MQTNGLLIIERVIVSLQRRYSNFTMSLFKLCTWWTAQCPDIAANYDSYLLHSCRFGLSDTEKDYIVVGSHSGYLSIFRPSATDADEDNDEFSIVVARPTDLLLEQKLANPIIGISSGRFMRFKLLL